MARSPTATDNKTGVPSSPRRKFFPVLLRRSDGRTQKYNFASRLDALTHPRRAFRPASPQHREIQSLRRDGFTLKQSVHLQSLNRQSTTPDDPSVSTRAPAPATTPRAPGSGSTAPASPEPARPPAASSGAPPGVGGAGGVGGADFRKQRGATYTTWFKAMGTLGSLADLRGAGGSPDILGGDLEEFAAPSAFYSNQSGILGRVKWFGIVKLEALIAELNLRLQFVGEEEPGFDFRIVYDQWEYEYQVIEHIGEIETRVAHVVDGKPKRR